MQHTVHHSPPILTVVPHHSTLEWIIHKMIESHKTDINVHVQASRDQVGWMGRAPLDIDKMKAIFKTITINNYRT